jgi:hypothetical protein
MLSLLNRHRQGAGFFCLGLEARIARIAGELEADQAETYEMPLEVLCGFAETPLG